MTFVAGKSGNPGGRPKNDDPVKQLARKHSPAAIRKLVALMKHEDGHIVAKACNSILDRAYGKPAQAITGDNGGPLRMIVETGVPQPDGEV